MLATALRLAACDILLLEKVLLLLLLPRGNSSC
jgi:hypothetical protein